MPCVVGGVLIWSIFEVWRTSKSTGVFEVFNNAHKFVGKLFSDVVELWEATVFFRGAPCLYDVRLPFFMSLRYFSESEKSWAHKAVSATQGRTEVMTEKVNFVDLIWNEEYGYAIAKLFNEELVVKKRVLKCGGTTIGMLTALEAVLLSNDHLSSHWLAKVRTTVVCAPKVTHVEDALSTKVRTHMALEGIRYVPLVILPPSLL